MSGWWFIWISVTSHERLSIFYCCQRHKLATKALLCDTQYFILLTLTCSSTIYTERIVVFPTQQWLRDRSTTLCYTYTADLVLFHCHKISYYITVSSIPVIIILTGLSTNAFNKAVYRKVVNSELERQIRNDNGLIWGTKRHLFEETRENHEKLQSGWDVSGLPK